ncbi:Acyl-CoA N-acyltransferase [Penicillium paradoxum]|uniref:Acyl-CoA N-acyltransferase n=1 Tax=Penicillium paradoxum TaxID=176176 RepID=UPI0025488A22|nr:Acyl-CoA N-acyltransferase [Penicillium paradoxum]KAJ5782900.1 Acyl-CoA N-acyltransferase [Penicillium paradoxum]
MSEYDLFKTGPLRFRNYNPSEHDEFFHTLYHSDPDISTSLRPSIPRPEDREFTSALSKELLENALLFAVIYDPDSYGMDYPLGTVFFSSSSPDMAHHRCSELKITFPVEHRAIYEPQTIDWALAWAFQGADLYRVEANLSDSHESRILLYETMGFTKEGTRRECFVGFRGRYSEARMSILQNEWTSETSSPSPREQAATSNRISY